MIGLMVPLASTVGAHSLQLFVGAEGGREDELRQIKSLADRWLMLKEEPDPDFAAIRRKERQLHLAIKSSCVYGMILNFAGLNLWVDDRTPDDVVESQEAINL